MSNKESQMEMLKPGMCVSLETCYVGAQGSYAPGPYNDCTEYSD
jgi:hypothetical protein